MKLVLVTAALLIIGLTVRMVLPGEEIAGQSFEKQKGVCWVGGRQVVTQSEFRPLIENHIQWISQTPFGWQSNNSSTEVISNTNFERTWWGESDVGIKQTTLLARQNKIKTILKPHLWVKGSWPGEIKMDSEENWQKWFSSYTDFILHYAKLAEAQDIEILCIGTELSHSTKYEYRWRDLIHKIRQVYSGKLTYAANFHNEYQHIKFWDALDFIGIQGYFSLSQYNNPTIEELKSGWSLHLETIEQLYEQYKKPVLFTEIGYRSAEDAAIEPWKWPQENKEIRPSDETQANCYEAFFSSVWQKKWVAGAYFWKWYPHGYHPLQTIDFTPQGKAAEKVLASHFKD